MNVVKSLSSISNVTLVTFSWFRGCSTFDMVSGSRITQRKWLFTFQDFVISHLRSFVGSSLGEWTILHKRMFHWELELHETPLSLFFSFYHSIRFSYYFVGCHMQDDRFNFRFIRSATFLGKASILCHWDMICKDYAYVNVEFFFFDLFS